MYCHILFCLPAARAATCWVLKTSGSRVAVSNARYSILSLPVRTHFCSSVGRAPSVKSLQIGHSRSPKYCSVTGAVDAPIVSPAWAMPPTAASTFLTRVGALLPGTILPPPPPPLPPPPAAIRTITIATTTTPTTTPSWVRRLRRAAPAASASSNALRSERACSRRCLRVRSSSSLSTGLIGELLHVSAQPCLRTVRLGRCTGPPPASILPACHDGSIRTQLACGEQTVPEALLRPRSSAG